MAVPFAPMPTLRDVIDSACANDNCRYGELQGVLVGPKGKVKARYLINRDSVIYPLPGVPDDWRLAPTVLHSLVRSLGLTGYDHLIRHLDDL